MDTLTFNGPAQRDTVTTRLDLVLQYIKWFALVVLRKSIQFIDFQSITNTVYMCILAPSMAWKLSHLEG